MSDINTGDTVHHIPSDESWLVAFVEGGKLCACGWPCSLEPLSDFVLVRKATLAERLKLLNDMASMKSSDPRRAYAQRELRAATSPGEAATSEDASDALQNLHNELYRAQTTDSLEVQARAIGKARILLSRYRDALAQTAPAQQCPNCKGTFSPTALDPEWKVRCECTGPVQAAPVQREAAGDVVKALMAFADEYAAAERSLECATDSSTSEQERATLESAMRAALQPTQSAAPMPWPKARDVGRLGDMSPTASIRIGFDSDNDVFVAIWGDDGIGSVEFCTPGAGGGKSPRTREALIALMVAMEAENAADPDRDWWARRNRKPAQGERGA